MSVLIGSTGFVGSHIHRKSTLTSAFTGLICKDVRNLETDLLVCAVFLQRNGVPTLIQTQIGSTPPRLPSALATVKAHRAVLISTVDVYQPPVGVDEGDFPAIGGEQAYGRNRTWFECFFFGRASQTDSSCASPDYSLLMFVEPHS